MTKRVRKAAWLVMFVSVAAGVLLSAMQSAPTARADDAGPNALVDPDDPKFAGRFSGRVTGPDGKPLSGAQIFIVPIDREFNTETTAIDDAGRVRAETDADGRFEFDAPDMTYVDLDGLAARRRGLISAAADGYGPDWIFIKERPRSAFAPPADRIKRNNFSFELAQDDVPIHGRFLSPDGRPLAGARIRLTNIMIPRQRNLDGHLGLQANLSIFASPPDFDRDFYYRPHQIQGLTAETSTDAEGRFTLSGLGRERLAHLNVSAPSVVDTDLTVMTRDSPDFATRPNFDGKPSSVIYGAGFTLELQPGRSISGLVRDWDSHEPIAGIWVGIGSENFLPSRTKDEIYPRDGVMSHQTTTDVNGRFTMTGLHLSPVKRAITAASAPGMTYRSASVFVEGDAPVLIECRRGIQFRLQVIDERGRPVDAEVTYVDVAPNPHAPKGFCYPSRRPLSVPAKRADGSYEGFVVPGPGALLVKTPGRAGYRPAYVDPKAFFAAGRTNWTAQERMSAYGTTDTVSISMGWADQNNYAAIVLVNPPVDSGPLELTATIAKDKPRRVSLAGPEGEPIVGVKTQGMTLDLYDAEPPLRAASFPLTKLHPDRVRRITFIHEDRQLIGFLLARGDGDAPYTVRMQRWAAVAGRIVDEKGNPLKVSLSLGQTPMQANPDPEVGEHPGVATGTDGRFHIDRLVPGQRYTARIFRQQRFVGTAFVKLVFKAGEVRDLGDIHVKSSTEVARASSTSLGHPRR